MGWLSDTEAVRLSVALHENFGREELRLLLQSKLGREMERLVTAVEYADQVAELVSRADERGWAPELLSMAIGERPNAETLISLHYRKAHLKVGGLENVVRAGSFINVADFITATMAVQRAVCSIKVIAAEEEVGTGFLVGPDLLLTNHHVVHRLIDHPEEVTGIVLNFDYSGPNTGTMTPCSPAELDVVAYSPPASDEAEEWPLNGDWREDRLDYALLRLPQKLGELPFAGKFVRLPQRGWLTLAKPKQRLAKGRILRITQHPYGGEMVLAEGKALALDAKKLRVRYEANTDRGSSGAPVFNEGMELVALHHRGNWAGTENQGIPITAILADLEAKGVSPPTSAPPPDLAPASGPPITQVDDIAAICEVLVNRPFIGRHGLKDYFATLLAGGTAHKVLLLNGRSRVGRSYLGHYFDKLAALGHFRLVKVDFRGRPGIHPGEVARQVAIALGLNDYHEHDQGERPEDFKQQIFLTQVEHRLLTAEDRHLFFFDHCHEHRLSLYVRDVIVGLANLIAAERVPGIFIGIGIETDDQVKINGIKPDLGNFAREDAEGYFSYLHAKHGITLPEKKFVGYAMGKLPDRLFDPGPALNVEEIGRRAQIITEADRRNYADFGHGRWWHHPKFALVMGKPLNLVELDALVESRLARAFGYQPEERPLVRAVAFTASFQEATLIERVRALGDPVTDRDVAWLREHTVAAPDGKWALPLTTRQTLLRDIDQTEAIQVMGQRYLPGDDPTAVISKKILFFEGNELPVETLPEPEVHRVVEVLDWLELTVTGQGYSELYGRCMLRIGREDLARSMRHHTATFSGREAELARLHNYVFSTTGEVDPLLIYGVGGVGKSTLVSKFILDHSSLLDNGNTACMYLDFDRAGLSIAEPEQLVVEVLRQLGLQFAEDDPKNYPIFDAQADHVQFSRARAGGQDAQGQPPRKPAVHARQSRGPAPERRRHYRPGARRARQLRRGPVSRLVRRAEQPPRVLAGGAQLRPHAPAGDRGPLRSGGRALQFSAPGVGRFRPGGSRRVSPHRRCHRAQLAHADLRAHRRQSPQS